MMFPLEKILEVDIDKYLESVGKELKDYNIRGVIVDSVIPGSINRIFQEEVPSNAEVVVNYHRELYGSPGNSVLTGANAYGTALIPK